LRPGNTVCRVLTGLFAAAKGLEGTVGMTFETDEEKLAALGYSAQFIKNLFPVDCMVAVTDCEKFVAYYPGDKIDIKARVNDSIANRVLAKAIRCGERIAGVVPREVHGIAFKTIVIN